MTASPLTDAGDPRRAAIKAAQAANFDHLNELVAGSAFDRHLRFLNFGYRPLPNEEPVGPSLGVAFPNKDSAQLLFQVVGLTPLSARTVLEVGCGRGGNLWLARRKLGADTVIGLDLAPTSVQRCAEAVPAPGAGFAVADAEVLPIGDATVDVVISIESAATYPDIERFHREAVRVLKPGGHLLYADIVDARLVDAFSQTFATLGMQELERRDITANVLAARDDRAERQRLAFADAADDQQRAVTEFAGSGDSDLYATLNTVHRYVLYRLQRTEVRPVPDRPLLDPDQRAFARASSEVALAALDLPASP